MIKIALFFVGSAVILAAFALAWPPVAPTYAQLQIFWVKPLVNTELHLTVDSEGIAVYRDEKFLTRREFLSFGGLGLTLALWVMTPGLPWKRRILWTTLGLVTIFLWHVLGLRGLIAFAEAVEGGQGGGLMTLLYSVIAVGDWVVPVVLWGAALLYYRGSGAAP